MRIVYVCPHYPPQRGGVETHVSEIASRLARRGHEVEVLTQATGRDESVEELDGVTVRRIRAVILAGRRVLPWRLWRYLRRHAGSWDVVHGHDFGRATALAAAYAGTRPMVFTPHFHGIGNPPTRLGRMVERVHRWASRRVLMRASCVICVSAAESDLLQEEFPAGAKRIAVIPNGTSRLRGDRATNRSREPLILSLGRVEAYKNIDAVIVALAHLPPGFTLRVIGDGSERTALTSLAMSAGSRGRVEFLGHVDDEQLDEALSASSVLVTMSDHEAFGLAALEALAAGVPVVASDIPAHRELRDRYGGAGVTLVPIGASPEELARAIADAAESDFEPRVDLPTWDRVAEMTMEVYGALQREQRDG